MFQVDGIRYIHVQIIFEIKKETEGLKYCREIYESEHVIQEETETKTNRY